MKKLFLLTACIALLCSCTKDQGVAPEKVMKSKAATKENITLNIQVYFANDPYYGISNVTPYGCQLACSDMMPSDYELQYIYFTIRDVYVHNGYDFAFHESTGIDAIEYGYSPFMPLARTYDTYLDANSLSVYPESDKYNFIFNVIGLPVRPYTPSGGGGGEIIPPTIDSPLRAAYPPIM